MGCRVITNSQGLVEKVTTKDGKRSLLFDEIMSIPFVGDKNSGADIYELFHSKSFIDRFGDWENNRIDSEFRYDTGEPMLFFKSSQGNIFRSYGRALSDSHAGHVVVGSLSEKNRNRISFDGSVYVNNESDFIPLFSIDATTQADKTNGIINRLIKKGYLSDRMMLGEDGSYHLTGAGTRDFERIYNTSVVADMLKGIVGYGNVRVSDDGMIDVDFPDASKIVVRNGDKVIQVDKDEVVRLIRSGRYADVAEMYHAAPELLVSVMLQSGDIFEDSNSLHGIDAQKEANDRHALTDAILSTGVNYLAIFDFTHDYIALNGVAPSSEVLKGVLSDIQKLLNKEDVVPSENTAYILLNSFTDEVARDKYFDLSKENELYSDVYSVLFSNNTEEDAVDIAKKWVAAKTFYSEIMDDFLHTDLFSSIESNLSFMREHLSVENKEKIDTALGINVVKEQANPLVEYGLEGSIALMSVEGEHVRSRLDSSLKRITSVKRRLSKILNGDVYTEEFVANAELAKFYSRLESLSGEENLDEVYVENALNDLISMAENEEGYINSVVDRMKRVHGNERVSIGLSARNRLAVLKEIKESILELYPIVDDKLKSNKQSDFFKRLDLLISSITRDEAEMNDLFKRDGSKIRQLMEKWGVPTNVRGYVESVLDATIKEISNISRWLGTLENSHNPVLSALGKLVSENKFLARFRAAQDTDAFLKTVQEKEWDLKKWRRLIQKDKSGAYGGYLLSKINMAEYEKQLRRTQVKALMKAFKDLNLELYDKYKADPEKFIDVAVEKGVTLIVGNETKEVGVSDSGEQTLASSKRTFRTNAGGINLNNIEQSRVGVYNDLMNDFYKENNERFFVKEYYQLKESAINVAALYKNAVVSEFVKSKIEAILSMNPEQSGVNFDIYAKKYLKDNGFSDEEIVKLFASDKYNDTATVIIENYERESSRLRAKFYKDGVFDKKAFKESPEYKLYLINESSFRERMSEYDGMGERKTGEDEVVSLMIRGYRNAMRNAMSTYERSLGVNVKEELSEYVGEDGVENKARLMEDFLQDGRLFFSDEYWKSFDENYSYIDMAENVLFDEGVRRSIRNSFIGSADNFINTLRVNVTNYEALRNRIKVILSKYKKPGTLSDISFDMMPSHTVQLIKSLQEQKDAVMANIRTSVSVDDVLLALEENGISPETYFTDNTETSFNDAFYREILDFSKAERFEDVSMEDFFDFMKDHLQSSDYEMLYSRNNSRYKRLKSYLSGSPVTLSQWFKEDVARILKDKYGLDVDINDRAKFSLAVTQQQIDGVMKEYCARYVMPYFKRSTLKGFNRFMRDINENNQRFSLSQFIEDKLLGRGNSQFGVIPETVYKYIDLTAPSSWYFGETLFDKYKNKNYDTSRTYGNNQPKIDKYRDENFYTHFGIEVDENGVESPTKNIEEFEMIETLKGLMKKNSEYYGESINQYMIPQVSKQSLERVGGLFTDPVSMVKNFIADKTMNRVDDPIYGQTASESIDVASDVRTVPKYYIHSLENVDDLSHDLGYSYTLMNLMANEYKQKMDTIDSFIGLEQDLLDLKFKGGRRVKDTNDWKMFRDYVDYHLYGVKMTNRMELDILGYKIDVSKIAIGFARFVESMNLAYSPMVSLKGITSNAFNQAIENMVGQYLDKNSTAFAIKEASKLGHDYIGEIGMIQRTNKLYVMGERMGIYDMRERFSSAAFNRTFRMFDNMGYKLGEVGQTMLDPIVMISVMDSMKYIPELNLFVDKYQFENMEYDNSAIGSWDAYKDMSLYKATDIVNGEMVLSEIFKKQFPEAEEAIKTGWSNAQSKISSIVQYSNGVLNEENKVAMRRHWLGYFFMSHRGWIVLAAQRMFKKKSVNFNTLQVEEGWARTWLNLLGVSASFLKQGNLNDISKVYKEYFEKLDYSEKINLKRGVVNMAVMAVFAILARGIQKWRDDDDEIQNNPSYLGELAFFLMLGSINEVYSQNDVLGLSGNVIEAIDEPIASSRFLQDIFDVVSRPTSQFDEVKGGTYKGDTRLMQKVYRNTFLRQWFNNRSAKDIKRQRRAWEMYNSKSMWLFLSRKDEDKKNKEGGY